MSNEEKLEREELKKIVYNDVEYRANRVAAIIDHHIRAHGIGVIIDFKTVETENGKMITTPDIDVIDLKLATDADERLELQEIIKSGIMPPLPVEKESPVSSPEEVPAHKTKK